MKCAIGCRHQARTQSSWRCTKQLIYRFLFNFFLFNHKDFNEKNFLTLNNYIRPNGTLARDAAIRIECVLELLC